MLGSFSSALVSGTLSELSKLGSTLSTGEEARTNDAERARDKVTAEKACVRPQPTKQSIATESDMRLVARCD